MKFKENLRWWVDWLGQLMQNDPNKKCWMKMHIVSK